MPIDKTDPIDHTKIGDVPGEIRQVKSNVIDTVAMEHVTPSDAVTGGEHLAGAARVYLQSGLATTSPDGNNLATAAAGPATNYDYGRVNVDTSNYNFIKVFNPAASSTMTGCWSNVSVGGVKASTNIDANSKNVVNLATGTQSGQPIHVGQIDTGFFSINEPATGAAILIKVSTGLATSHAGGIINDVVKMYSPTTTYAGEESVTHPNGLIEKRGYISRAGNNTTLTFNTPFANEVIAINVTVRHTQANIYAANVTNLATGSARIYHDASATGYYWSAIGR